MTTDDITAAIAEIQATAAKVSEAMATFETLFAEHGMRLTAETWAALDKMAQKRRTDRYKVYKKEGRAEALRQFPQLPRGANVSDLLIEAVALLLEQQSKKPKAA